MNLRALGFGDLPQLLSLESRLFTADDYPLSRRAMRYHLQRGNFFVGMFEGERLCGYLLGFTYPHSGRIYSIAVDHDFRGKGIAKRLIDAAADHYRAGGKKRLLLEVRTTNAAAVALYGQAGFQTSKRLEGYYADGGDALKMVKAL